MEKISNRNIQKLNKNTKNNNLENVLINWIVDGNENDKQDAFEIFMNLDYAISNILKKNTYTEINITTEIIKNRVFSNILENLLCDEGKYNLNSNKDFSIINTRIWLITILCICCLEENKEKCFQYLNRCFQDNTDNYTKFYAAEGIINHFSSKVIENKHNFIQDFINQHNILSGINNEDVETIPKYKWAILLWIVSHKNVIRDDNMSIYEKKINEVFTNKSHGIEEFIYSFGSIPCELYINDFIKMMEHILEDEKSNKLETKYITFYISLFRACIGIRYLENIHLDKDKEYITILLFRYLKLFRTYPDSIWNHTVLIILRALRKFHQILPSKIVIDNLEAELLDSDPNIIRSACKTLQTFHETKKSTQIILDAVNKEIQKNGKDSSSETVIALSNALKWMSQKNNQVLEQLEDKMYRGDDDIIKDTARKLISEMGGTTAMKKLQVREGLKENYSKRIENAQKDIENMFKTTIKDAKLGFNIAMSMEVIVFLVGITLICVSGFMAIFSGGVNEWAGVGASGGAGVLTIMYSLFIGKPRDKVKENINHLMHIKVIFLGYLRELNQADQCFNQHLLEDETIPIENINIYLSSIDNIMNSCSRLLNNCATKINEPTKVTVDNDSDTQSTSNRETLYLTDSGSSNSNVNTNNININRNNNSHISSTNL